jgi:hypothetical protein
LLKKLHRSTLVLGFWGYSLSTLSKKNSYLLPCSSFAGGVGYR